MLNLQTFTVSHLMTHAGKGVYPYLPMATYAPWWFFLRRMNKKLLKHVFGLYSLPIIFSKNFLARYARSIASYPQLTNAICFTNTIYIFFSFLVSLSLTASFQSSLKTRIKLHKIAYKMSKNCLRGTVGGGEAWRKRGESWEWGERHGCWGIDAPACR